MMHSRFFAFLPDRVVLTKKLCRKSDNFYTSAIDFIAEIW